MASFFEKLKKGMRATAKIKEPAQKPKKTRQIKTPALNKEMIIEPPKELKIDPEPIKKIEIEGMDKSFDAAQDKEDWFKEPAGQLAIDVFQTEQDLIIQAAIAGIKPGNLEITVERDVVAIKGIRQKPSEENGDYFVKECYWGPFTREVIVPIEIDPDRVEAIMQEGILTVKMPKILREKKRTIAVKT